jgi:hypothetical protein
MSYHHNNDRNSIIAKMNKYWYIDTKNLEIGLNKMPWYNNLFNWLTVRRFSVRELYVFIYNHFHSEENIASLMSIPFPIDHDNIKKPKGVPFNYVMQNDWKITDNALKKLIKGPLISEHGYILLVKTESQKEIVIRTIGKVIGWLSIPGALYGSWEVIKIIMRN